MGLASWRSASRLPSPFALLCLCASLACSLFRTASFCAAFRFRVHPSLFLSFCLAPLPRGLRFTLFTPASRLPQLQAYVFLRSPWFTYSFVFLWITVPALWVAPDAPVRVLGVFFSFFSFWCFRSVSVLRCLSWTVFSWSLLSGWSCQCFCALLDCFCWSLVSSMCGVFFLDCFYWCFLVSLKFCQMAIDCRGQQ